MDAQTYALIGKIDANCLKRLAIHADAFLLDSSVRGHAKILRTELPLHLEGKNALFFLQETIQLVQAEKLKVRASSLSILEKRLGRLIEARIRFWLVWHTADHAALLRGLTSYAARRLAGYSLAEKPDDFAHDALTKVRNGSRVLKSLSGKKLFIDLCGVVKSLIYNKLKHEQRLVFNDDFADWEAINAGVEASGSAWFEQELSPAEACAEAEKEQAMDQFFDLLERFLNPNSDDLLVLRAIRAGCIKPSHIAAEYDISVKSIYQSKARLRDLIHSVFRKTETVPESIRSRFLEIRSVLGELFPFTDDGDNQS